MATAVANMATDVALDVANAASEATADCTAAIASAPGRIAAIRPSQMDLLAYARARKAAVTSEGHDDDSDDEETLADLPPYTALADDPPPPRVRGRHDQVYNTTNQSSWLHPHEQPRRPAIFIVESDAFEYIVLATILLNCVTMALRSPLLDRSDPFRIFLSRCDLVFLYIYTIEQLFNMLAYGLDCSKGSFLFNKWALFECFIVVVSW